MENTITNPVTGERVTFTETSRQSGGARAVGILEAKSLGGVPRHSHDAHDERIDVLEGVIEVTLNGTKHVLGAGEHIVIPKGSMHAWRNPSPERVLRFRGTMTPGHPGFETAVTVLFLVSREMARFVETAYRAASRILRSSLSGTKVQPVPSCWRPSSAGWRSARAHEAAPPSCVAATGVTT